MSEPPADELAGWQVLDPDGSVVAAGPQTVLDASADAGEET